MIRDLPSDLDIAEHLLEIDRVECEENLYTFFKSGWPQIDTAPWVDGWCMEAMADHLQAVRDGVITRLVCNISPRCSKSNLFSVAFTAWIWAQPNDGPICGPKVKMVGASYASQLSLRDNRKCRQLIESDWYQKRWGRRFQLTSDQNTKSRFTNDKGGERLITSIDGTGTGEGGMCILIDDPNSVDDVDSEATIERAINWWDGVMPTRLDNQKTGAYIIIQQRTFENDLTGHVLETEGDDWVHLMIPMRYEPERSYHTVIGWKDPRTVPGELMWPERFGEREVKRLERKLGPYRAAGQLQQRPEPAGGGIIERQWFGLWESDAYPPMDYICAMLDTAYTEEDYNDPSAMIILGVFTPKKTRDNAATTAAITMTRDAAGHLRFKRKPYSQVNQPHGVPHVMLMYAWREWLKLHDLVKKVAETAKRFRIDMLKIENKASGISVDQEIRRLYRNETFGVQLYDPKSQDKTARLISVQHLFAEGLVYAPGTQWAEMVINEVCQYPKAKHKDLTDCVSMGMRHLRDVGLLARSTEIEDDEEALKVYPGGREASLYPV